MIGFLDAQVIEKFNEFQKHTEKYLDLDIDKVRFEKIPLSNKKYFQFIKGKNKYIQDYISRNQGEYPILGSSLKNDCIAGRITPIDMDDIVQQECVSFNKDNAKGSQPFYRDYPFLMDRHHIAILPSDKISPKYLYYSLKYHFDKSKFGWGENVASVEKVQKHSIPVPDDLNDKYTSSIIQEVIVEFLEHSFENINKVQTNFDKYFNIINRMKKSLIPSVFKRAAIQNRFKKYAKENNIYFEITDVEFNSTSFDEFFEVISADKKIKNNELKKSGLYPVVSQSETFINGYYDNNNGIIHASNSPVIVFGDHTTILKYIDFDFLAGADGVKILKVKNNIFPKYAYYQSFNKVKNQGYQRHFQYFKEQEFLIPSLDGYLSIELQKIIASFIEHIENEIQEKHLNKINGAYGVIDKLRKTYLARTFSLIDWGGKR